MLTVVSNEVHTLSTSYKLQYPYSKVLPPFCQNLVNKRRRRVLSIWEIYNPYPYVFKLIFKFFPFLMVIPIITHKHHIKSQFFPGLKLVHIFLGNNYIDTFYVSNNFATFSKRNCSLFFLVLQ